MLAKPGDIWENKESGEHWLVVVNSTGYSEYICVKSGSQWPIGYVSKSDRLSVKIPWEPPELYWKFIKNDLTALTLFGKGEDQHENL